MDVRIGWATLWLGVVLVGDLWSQVPEPEPSPEDDYAMRTFDPCQALQGKRLFKPIGEISTVSSS